LKIKHRKQVSVWVAALNNIYTKNGIHEYVRDEVGECVTMEIVRIIQNINIKGLTK
jgi:hypothetical protein